MVPHGNFLQSGQDTMWVLKNAVYPVTLRVKMVSEITNVTCIDGM